MLGNSRLVLGCALVATLVLVQGSLGLGTSERLFNINGPELVSKHEVATQLRHFLSKKLGLKERCERYALALAEFEKKDSLNYFKMAELATMDKRRASAEFKKILWLQLMNLYKSGLENFQRAHKVNEAMVELHACLKTDFGSREAKAIEFLNNKDLQKAVNQWNLISKESAELLTGQKQHSSLRLEELHRDVASSVAQWLAGGERDLPKLFASVNQQRQPQARAAAFAQAGHFKEPEPVVQAPKPGPAQLQSEAQNQPRPELKPKPQVQAETQPHPEEQDQLQWSETEAKFLNEMIENLSKLYDALPADTPLAVKCRAYNDVISQNEQPASVPEGRQSDETFTPSQSERANFLFMVRMVEFNHGAEGLFLDMAYCAEQWKDSDDEIRDYFNSAEYSDALESIKPPEEPVESESVNQPAPVK